MNLELEKTQSQTVKQNLDQYFEQLEPYFASLKERSEATRKQIDDIQKQTSLLEKEKFGIESTVSGQVRILRYRYKCFFNNQFLTTFEGIEYF